MTRAWWGVCAAIMLPIALWAVSTLWFAGATGKISDDWSLTHRDPATGAAPSPFNPWARYPYFWRPLHVAMIFTVGTFAYDVDWPVGVFVAAMHLLAAWSLFRLMRTVTSSWPAPALAAMLWLVHPVHYEVSLWFSSTCTAIGTVLAIQLLLWQRRILSRPNRPGWGPLALQSAGIFLFALAVPGFYEQPAAFLGAAPIYLWVSVSRSGRTTPDLRRILRVTLPAWLACGTYVALMILTAPAHARGGGNSFVNTSNALSRLQAIGDSLWSILGGVRVGQLIRGSWQVGTQVLNSGVGLSVVVGLIAAGVAWIALAVFAPRAAAVAPIRDEAQPGTDAGKVVGSPHHPLSARLLMVFAGGAIAALSLLPVAVLARQTLEVRNAYVLLAGLAIVLSQGLDSLWSAPSSMSRRIGRRSVAEHPEASRSVFASPLVAALRGLVVIPLIGLTILACVCNVGTQQWLHRRSAADASIIDQLRTLVPEPPERAVFMPIRVAHAPSETGEFMFDNLRPGILTAVWAANSRLAHAFHRRDVEMVSWNPWAAPTIVGVTSLSEAEGSTEQSALPAIVRVHPWRSGRRQVFDLRRVIPFAVDATGTVRLIERLTIESPSGALTRLIMPTVAAIKQTGGPDAESTTNGWIVVASERAMSLGDFYPLQAREQTWNWAVSTPGDRSSDVEFSPIRAWGHVERATWLRPALIISGMPATSVPSASPLPPSEALATKTLEPRSAMESTIGPLEGTEPNRLTIRGTILERDLEANPLTKGPRDGTDPRLVMVVRLFAVQPDGQEREVGALVLEPAELRRARRWTTAVVRLAPNQSHWIRARVEAWVATPADGPQGAAGSLRIESKDLPSVWLAAGRVYPAAKDPPITLPIEPIEAPISPQSPNQDRAF